MPRKPSFGLVCLSLAGFAGSAHAADLTDPELAAAVDKCDGTASRTACEDIAQQLVDVNLVAFDTNKGVWNSAASIGDLTTVGALLIDAFNGRFGALNSRVEALEDGQVESTARLGALEEVGEFVEYLNGAYPVLADRVSATESEIAGIQAILGDPNFDKLIAMGDEYYREMPAIRQGLVDANTELDELGARVTKLEQVAVAGEDAGQCFMAHRGSGPVEWRVGLCCATARAAEATGATSFIEADLLTESEREAIFGQGARAEFPVWNIVDGTWAAGPARVVVNADPEDVLDPDAIVIGASALYAALPGTVGQLASPASDGARIAELGAGSVTAYVPDGLGGFKAISFRSKEKRNFGSGKYALDLDSHYAGWSYLLDGGTAEFAILDAEGIKTDLVAVVNPTEKHLGTAKAIVFTPQTLHELVVGTPLVGPLMKQTPEIMFQAWDREIDEYIAQLRANDAVLADDIALLDTRTDALEAGQDGVKTRLGFLDEYVEEGFGVTGREIGELDTRVEALEAGTDPYSETLMRGFNFLVQRTIDIGDLADDTAAALVDTQAKVDDLGQTLHTIQDSYAAGRTERGSRRLVFPIAAAGGVVTYDEIVVTTADVDPDGYHVDFGKFAVADVLSGTAPVPPCSLVYDADGNPVTSLDAPIEVCISEEAATKDLGVATITLAEAALLTTRIETSITTYVGN